MRYLPFAFLQAAACYLVGLVLGAEVGPGALASLLVLLPMAASCVGIGLVLGALCTENQISGLGSVLVAAIGYLGGGWFDLASAGGFFAFMGRYFPFARAVEGARALFGGAPVGAVLPDIAIAWAFGILALAAGGLCLRSRAARR